MDDIISAFEIEKLKPDSVLLLTVMRGNMPHHRFVEYIDSIRHKFSKAFPDNKIVVVADNVEVDVVE